MTLSHRDHRIDDSIARAFWSILALVGAVGIVAFVAPWAVLGAAALVALAVVGGYYVVRSERSIQEYVGDLRSVHGGGDASGWVRVEVGSQVAVERPIGLPTRRSPHARPPTGPGQTVPPTPGPRT